MSSITTVVNKGGTKMNVGDHVRFVKYIEPLNEDSERKARLGDTGVVIRNNTGCSYPIDLKFDGDAEEFDYCFKEDELEVIAVGKFKVSDRVTVVDSPTLLTSQRKYLGKTFRVKEVFLRHGYDGANFYELDGIGTTFRENELELASATMDYKEALKAVIDGETVQNEEGARIYMDNGVFYLTRDGYDSDVLHQYLQGNTDSWTIVKEQSKFAIGDLFVNPKGKLGKVLAYEGHSRYTVRFNFKDANNKQLDYPEAHMVKFVQVNN